VCAIPLSVEYEWRRRRTKLGVREGGGRNVHHSGERERERGGLTVGRDNGGCG